MRLTWPDWWPTRLTPELAPFRSGQGWPDDQGGVVTGNTRVDEWELSGTAAAPCKHGALTDCFQCETECVHGEYGPACRFCADGDPRFTVDGGGSTIDHGSGFWLDAHRTGTCYDPTNVSCNGECGG